jgi:hypothetical protein
MGEQTAQGKSSQAPDPVQSQKEGCEKEGAIMSQSNVTPHEQAERARETAEARASLEQRAAEQGVEPFTSLEDFAGDPELTADFDVDEFLRMVRETRDTPSNRSMS